MKGALIAAIIFGLISLSGCASLWSGNKSSDVSAPLEPNAVVRFMDVPVPAGFRLLDQDSYAFENAGVRVAMLKYKGKGSIDQISNFYKTQMAMHSWVLLNAIEYGQRLLNFDRETESCIISLFPKGSTTLVTVSLGPKSQSAPKKPDKPLK